ncbi:MAG: RNA polymerase sigma-70 factor [Saprospiraceae bacterium]|nr:RNA polymerase sigma-70 factor [Saprospiraceae bacterium]MBP6569326.1 RNA polymerase sigma-70 factor [Saprospiraceae bacterium]
MDKSSFKNLFELHYSPLCNFAYRITDDIDQAEDIVQDIFVKVWNDPDLLDGNKNINSYLYSMVRNRALEVIRRENISQKINQQLEYIQNNAATTNVEEDEIEKLLLLEQIYVSIRQLPPKCSEVFTLSKVNGLTYVQIAEKMNISVKTVENHMGKALRLMRELLTKSLK